MPPGIESKILGGNNYQSDYTRQTEIFRNNILRTFVTPQSQAGNEKSNQNVAEYINDSAITGFIVNLVLISTLVYIAMQGKTSFKIAIVDVNVESGSDIIVNALTKNSS